MVNRAWGEDLDMPTSNALLVNTGLAAPASLRAPIERIVGNNASVQRHDTAARYGLDPERPADRGLHRRRIAVGGRHLQLHACSAAAGSRPRRRGSPPTSAPEVPILGSVTCNTGDSSRSSRAALLEVQARGLAGELHPWEYAGCYYPRFIAGTTTLSNHSFGLALDLNVPGNQRGTVGEMDRDVVSIFEKWGFTWGGDWRYTDPMHFELSGAGHGPVS